MDTLAYLALMRHSVTGSRRRLATSFGDLFLFAISECYERATPATPSAPHALLHKYAHPLSLFNFFKNGNRGSRESQCYKALKLLY